MSKIRVLFVLLSAFFGVCFGGNSVFSQMPVEEVTVFKDGHAFVLHEGMMEADEHGEVVLDYLPRPVIGTFWAYSGDERAKLKSVVASKKIVGMNKTAMSIAELVEANIGKRVHITENKVSYDATIIEVLKQSREEFERLDPPGSDERLAVTSNIVMLKLDEGTKAVQINMITDITFLDDAALILEKERFRNSMTLKFDAGKKKVPSKLGVGMVYLQKGIRWIPSYRIDIDGEGNAVFKLQATLVNEMIDLEGVKAHLVIGVPSFAFKDTIDPISLQDTVAQLGRQFQENNRTAYGFSNAIMSQSARYSERPRRSNHEPVMSDFGPVDLGPSITGSQKHEDLYVFTLENVSLKKGERMVVPVAEFTVKYSDLYKLKIPFAPPLDVRRHYNSNRQMELAKILGDSKVKHVIRVENTSEYPLTTAPAMIFREGQILAQGMTRYTAVGGTSDIELTVAVDVKVKKKDIEVDREENFKKWKGHSLDRVDMEGSVKLTNYFEKTIDLEVVRMTMGKIDSASHDGEIEQKDIHESGDFLSGGLPEWWNWYSWPWWWYHHNSLGQVEWKFSLEAGGSIDLGYKWHYLWD